jgi:hypothetical protein
MLSAVHAVWLLAALKLSLQLELGPEYDSNANRAEVIRNAPTGDTPTGSFLLRTTIRGGLTWRAGPNLLRVGALVGGKVFFSPAVQDQNVIVGQINVEDRVQLHRAVDLGVSGSYYDAKQLPVITDCMVRSCDRHRDFRSGSAVLRLGFRDGPGALALWGGYRGFEWKPDPAFDFQAGQAGASSLLKLHVGPPDGEHEIDLAATYHFERRQYPGPQEVNGCMPGEPLRDTCITFGTDRRGDWFHDAMVELTYVTKVLASVGYGVQLNQSNSFGQSLLRHIITVKLAFRLPWEIYVTLKGQLLLNRYLDPILLDRQVNSQTFISIEDENRNAVVIDLERPFSRIGLALNARYSLYTNELSDSPVSFLRQVVYLGLTYRLSSK